MKWIVVLLVLAAVIPARANPCETEAHAAEQALSVPQDLLLAIGRVESGRRDQAGRVAPWPWSVNAAGVGHFLASASEAIDLVQALQARGVRSIDVGCFQVNLQYHPNAFPSLADAFNPASNASAAGQILSGLKASLGSWDQAVASYHSADPAFGLPYLRQVMVSWHGGATMAQPPASQVALLVQVIVPSAFTGQTRALSGSYPTTRSFGPHQPVVIVPRS